LLKVRSSSSQSVEIEVLAILTIGTVSNGMI
jgi:hypothetical protein